MVVLEWGKELRPMPTPQEYRQQAEECLELARQTKEYSVKAALIEMAADFNEIAEKLEDKQKRAA
jgi:hypothetical protein